MTSTTSDDTWERGPALSAPAEALGGLVRRAAGLGRAPPDPRPGAPLSAAELTHVEVQRDR